MSPRKKVPPQPSANPLDRLLADPAAIKWLEKHPEFSLNSYRGGNIAFPEWTSPEGRFFVQQLEEVHHLLSRRNKRVARGFLRYTPAELAERRQVPVRVVYRQYERLRRTVRKLWDGSREAQLGARGDAVELDTLPHHVAVATRSLDYHGLQATVYRVPTGDRLVWVDAQSRALPDEVQELLDNLHDYAADFEHLDAE